MSGTVALSTAATVALVAGILVGLAFVGVFIALAVRSRPEQPPDIPPGMQPGPADEVLERRHLERVEGWGIVFVLAFALAVAVVWLMEPGQNVDDTVELISRSTHRGETWFQVASEENPTGFGCEQCHGEKGAGGQEIVHTTPEGEQIFVTPPPLNDVCARLTIEGAGQIRETIMQGREGTAMPSWSVRFAGPMNDQQIQDLINYILSFQQIPEKDNLCLNPPAEGEAGGGADGTDEGAGQQPDS